MKRTPFILSDAQISAIRRDYDAGTVHREQALLAAQIPSTKAAQALKAAGIERWHSTETIRRNIDTRENTMATQTTIPTGDLNLLFQNDSNITEPKIKGYSQVIRVKPDLITGELLNIGVIFRPLRKTIIHSRLLPSAYPFKVLYGNNGMDNFSLLIELLRDSLKRNIIPSELSPHIVWGERTYAQGDSIEEILNYTYHTMVTLADVKPDKDDNNKVITIDNKEARRKIATQLNRIDPGTYKRIYLKLKYEVQQKNR